jgi:hypothetical protein
MQATHRLSSILGPPFLVASTASVLYLTPAAVLGLLAAWTLVSIPVGILLGHCVLRED